ncbi:hypothetical protein OKW40_006801 [Paraburkholderia sp. RAU6.4a]
MDYQESTGGGFSISQGGGSASFSHTDASASGSYAGVNEQAGISAGDGGFNISVVGNTDLKGGLIALFARLWIKTVRGVMDDDPLAHLIEDHGSLLTILIMVATVMTAHFVQL